MLTIMEKVDLLQGAALFAQVRTSSLARIAALAQEVGFEVRQVLYRENEAPDALFVLLEGEVALTRAGREEDRLVRMQIAGAVALLADEPRAESATASRPVRAFRISQQDLFEAMAEDFNIVRGILRSFALMTAGR